MRAAGLKVLRVFLLSTRGGGAVAACGDTPVGDVEPLTVGVYDDTILAKLDDLLHEASIGFSRIVALYHRSSDSYQMHYRHIRCLYF